VALALFEAAKERGVSCRLMDHIEAAANITLMISGITAEVVPDVPTFFRLPRPLPIGSNSDLRFHYTERLATLWAALSLSRSPVINRPDRYGLLSRWSKSASVIGSRARIRSSSELFCKSNPVSAIGDTDEMWWIEDLVLGEVSALPQLPKGCGPYQCCPGYDRHKHCLAIVVDEEVFIVGPDDVPTHSVRALSKTVMLELGVCFGTTGWEINIEDGEACLISVNPHPSLCRLAPAWHLVAPAIIACLLKD
jgi:hypothetical protein